MTITIDLNGEFYALLAVSVVAALLTGSTLQWVAHNGYFKNQYNIMVTVAAISSLIQTTTCYVNTLIAPDHNLGFTIYILINWVIMTHSSVMLVSRKLSLTFLNPSQAWRRLLLINLFMFPVSLFICVYWATAQNFENDTFQTINAIMEPVQIALWGIIEFCLSGYFIIQMWKFHWTAVERRGIFVLVLVAICDTMSVLLNVFIGDLPSTSVKGFVYCLRIRLEVNVLVKMVDFVKRKRRGSVSYGGPSTGRHSRGVSSNRQEGGSSFAWRFVGALGSKNTLLKTSSTNPASDQSDQPTPHDRQQESARNTSATGIASKETITTTAKPGWLGGILPRGNDNNNETSKRSSVATAQFTNPGHHHDKDAMNGDDEEQQQFVATPTTPPRGVDNNVQSDPNRTSPVIRTTMSGDLVSVGTNEDSDIERNNDS